MKRRRISLRFGTGGRRAPIVREDPFQLEDPL
jgi:hypothetical protein